MPQTTVHLRTIQGKSAAVGWSGPHTVLIDRPKEAGGMGIGFNGGEMLFLAIGGCYVNDLYREAAKRNIEVKGVEVVVSGDWGGEPVRAQNVSFSAKVEAAASKEEISDLIRHTDKVAEIPNSLRFGTPISLSESEAVSV